MPMTAHKMAMRMHRCMYLVTLKIGKPQNCQGTSNTHRVFNAKERDDPKSEAREPTVSVRQTMSEKPCDEIAILYDKYQRICCLESLHRPSLTQVECGHSLRRGRGTLGRVMLFQSLCMNNHNIKVCDMLATRLHFLCQGLKSRRHIIDLVELLNFLQIFLHILQPH